MLPVHNKYVEFLSPAVHLSLRSIHLVVQKKTSGPDLSPDLGGQKSDRGIEMVIHTRGETLGVETGMPRHVPGPAGLYKEPEVPEIWN